MTRLKARDLAAKPSGVTVRLGVVKVAPDDETGPVGVAYASRPDHLVAVTDDWNRDGTNLPAEGARCTLLTSPGHDPIVLTWSPNA